MPPLDAMTGRARPLLVALAGAIGVLVAAVALQREPGPGPPGPPAAAPAVPSSEAPRRVMVPEVVGLPTSQARGALESLGLRGEVVAPVGADAGLVAAGRVTASDPVPGSTVAPGSTVRLKVVCAPTCVAPLVPSTSGAPCQLPGEADAPVVEPDRVAPGGPVRVHGPAFAGEPEVRILVGERAEVPGLDAAEVARGRARPAPDCTYDLSFTAPRRPADYSVFILLDPPARLEPSFDLTVR